MGLYGIEIDKTSEVAVRRQIYTAIRDQIIHGRLVEDEILPSTRELAKNLLVSRNTVSEAYDMLITEGYVISRQGAPTRIARGLQLEASSDDALSDNLPSFKITADFHTGRPDLKSFPRYLWQQLQHKASEQMPLELFGYCGPQGLPALRGEISDWLFRYRGLKPDPEDIFITSGATHALHLIAELLCNNEQGVIIEDPCHTSLIQTFVNKGCSIIPIPVDEFGMQTDYLDTSSDASAIYVTPSHQFPLGGILPATRRAALIYYARDKDIYIIEDDYDSEFRYCGEPVAPLVMMDPQRVIYVGTFSKTIFPALRIGYVILPRKLQKDWKELRTYSDVQNPSFEQVVLTEFLSSRKYDRHISKMRKIYGERRLVLLDAVKKEFGSNWRVYGDAAGLHLALEFPGLNFDESFKKSCLQNGIYITPLEMHCIIKGRHQDKLLMGYGHLEPKEIRKGVQILHNMILGEGL